MPFDPSDAIENNSPEQAGLTQQGDPGRVLQRGRVAMVVPSLARGGAEAQLGLLAPRLADLGWHVTVITLGEAGPVADDLRRARVAVRPLGLPTLLHPNGLLALKRVLRDAAPDIVYSVLPLANVACALIASSDRERRLVWGIRGSDRHSVRYGAKYRSLQGLQRRLQTRADLVICNSHSGRRACEAGGYATDRLAVVSNGVDVRRFRPDGRHGESVRRSLGLSPDNLVFALVGNFDLVKGHEQFLFAAAKVGTRHPATRFLCLGGGAPTREASLRSLGDELRLASQLLWLGRRDDIESIYQAIDVVVSCSASEGQSNALLEGKASGCLTVATDVGDSRFIVGDEGFVATRRSSQDIAEAMEKLLVLDRRQRDDMSAAARADVGRRFSPDVLALQTTELFSGLLGDKSADRPPIPSTHAGVPSTRAEPP